MNKQNIYFNVVAITSTKPSLPFVETYSFCMFDQNEIIRDVIKNKVQHKEYAGLENLAHDLVGVIFEKKLNKATIHLHSIPKTSFKMSPSIDPLVNWENPSESLGIERGLDLMENQTLTCSILKEYERFQKPQRTQQMCGGGSGGV